MAGKTGGGKAPKKVSAPKRSASAAKTEKGTVGTPAAAAAPKNKPFKLNKKLLARVSGTTKGEVRGVVKDIAGRGQKPKALYKLAKGGPTAGAKRGSTAQKRATREVRSYLKAKRSK
jgi:hypothetical protein